MLFDTHCHLDDPRLSAQLDEVLGRAREAGVKRIATIGCAQGLDNVRAAVNLAQQHPDWISATVGVHPHDAKDLDEELRRALTELGAEASVVAIGETGLDYHYDHSPRETQQDAFRAQIAIARQLGKPLVVHTRSAAEDTLRILREEDARDVGGIIHCFSEDAEFAAAALDLSFVSSFSGIVTFKSATAIQDAARKQPADALLIETDAPYLAPSPKRGKLNEPAYVAHTAAFIAELRGVPAQELAAITYENALRLFGITEDSAVSCKSEPAP